MSELKVNKISPQSGTAFTLGDSGDTFTVPSGATLTVAGTLTQTGAQTFDGGVEIDNFTINGSEIDLSSGDMTLDSAGDIILDADGADLKFQDGGTDILSITNNSTDVDITVATQDKDINFKGDDGGSGITALSLDMSDAGTAVFNHDIRIADGGQIGSASDADAIAIAANGVVTFSQAPVLPIGGLDIDGATDIGAAIADADLFVIDDGAGGTNRKTAASRIKTYVGNMTPSFLAYLSADAQQAQNADTKIAFNTEMYDNSGVYDNSSNYRFTPGVAGKYYIFATVGAYGGSRGYKQITTIKKNGTVITSYGQETDLTTNWTASFVRNQSVSVIDIADADDYYEVFVLVRLASSGNVTIDYNANTPVSHFGAFRIIE